MLVETLLLATAGGVVGLTIARWVLDTIAALRPRDIALVDRIPLDARAAVIACGVTIVAALAAGLLPAVQLSRPAAVAALREGRTSGRRGLRGALVVVEVAAALILAVAAGLMVRSFVSIRGVDPGFSRDDVSVLQVFASRRLDTAPKRIVFFQQALDRLRALPGVLSVGGTSSMPFGDARVVVRVPIAVTGRPAPPGEGAMVYSSAVSGDYFGAMSVPLLAGRLFDATDTAASRQVVLVSRTAARRFWGAVDPVGSKVRFRFTGTAYDAEVVGVVGDVRHDGLDAPTAAEVYVPYAQSGFYGLTFVVRTAPGTPADFNALKEQIWALDPLQPIFATARLEQLISKTLTAPRFHLFVLGGFGLITLLLATAGVYGVMSVSTSQRTREFGVRLALGATRRDIVGLVLGEGLTLAAIGVSVGVAVALPLTRLLRSLLFGVTATDPATFVIVSLTLGLAALAACYVPASRALKVDPVQALRID
jgi:putative ABC transport system permease protein